MHRWKAHIRRGEQSSGNKNVSERRKFNQIIAGGKHTDAYKKALKRWKTKRKPLKNLLHTIPRKKKKTKPTIIDLTESPEKRKRRVARLNKEAKRADEYAKKWKAEFKNARESRGGIAKKVDALLESRRKAGVEEGVAQWEVLVNALWDKDDAMVKYIMTKYPNAVNLQPQQAQRRDPFGYMHPPKKGWSNKMTLQRTYDAKELGDGQTPLLVTLSALSNWRYTSLPGHEWQTRSYDPYYYGGEREFTLEKEKKRDGFGFPPAVKDPTGPREWLSWEEMGWSSQRDKMQTDPNYKDPGLAEGIHYVWSNKAIEQYRKVIGSLLSDPRTNVNATDREGNRAIHYAARAGWLYAVKRIIEHPTFDGNVEIKGEYRTPAGEVSKEEYECSGSLHPAFKKAHESIKQKMTALNKIKQYLKDKTREMDSRLSKTELEKKRREKLAAAAKRREEERISDEIDSAGDLAKKYGYY